MRRRCCEIPAARNSKTNGLRYPDPSQWRRYSFGALALMFRFSPTSINRRDYRSTDPRLENRPWKKRNRYLKLDFIYVFLTTIELISSLL